MRRKIGLYTVFCVVWACGGLPDLWWEEMEQGSVLYVMDWSVPLKADIAFETANGYEITLSEASLNHWVVQLTPCQSSSSRWNWGSTYQPSLGRGIRWVMSLWKSPRSWGR